MEEYFCSHSCQHCPHHISWYHSIHCFSQVLECMQQLALWRNNTDGDMSVFEGMRECGYMAVVSAGNESTDETGSASSN